MSKKVSWIIPCFNEEEVINETIIRVKKVCDSIVNYEWEIIIIDDGSKDKTIDIVKSLIKNIKGISFIKLSRNYGHQIAVQAGLNNVTGDAAIIIDADLQDPPELAQKMLIKWEEGYNVVCGRRIKRKSETIFKKITAKYFYRLLNLIADIEIHLDTGDFRLIDRKVISAIKEMPEKERFLRGLISWAGFKQTQIDYIREKRYGGESKYPLFKMMKFAVEGITSFSRKPLQISILVGMISSLLSFIGIGYVLYIRLMTQNWVAGWAGISLAILLTSGLQLISIGVLGEYVGKIYLEAKNRPLYIIEERMES